MEKQHFQESKTIQLSKKALKQMFHSKNKDFASSDKVY